MSDDSGFIVEILLKAVDQASPALRNLNRTVDELKAKSAAAGATDDLKRGLDDVGDSANDAEQDLRGHREETERGSQSMQKHAQSADKAAKSHDNLASSSGNARDRIKAVGDASNSAADSHSKAAAEAENLARAQDKLEQSLKNGTRSQADYARSMDQISRAYEKLSKSLPIADELGDKMHQSSLDAAMSATQFEQAARRVADAKKIESAAIKQTAADSAKAAADAERDAQKTQAAADKAAATAERDAQRAQVAAEKAAAATEKNAQRAQAAAQKTADIAARAADKAAAAQMAADEKATASAEKARAKIQAGMDAQAEAAQDLVDRVSGVAKAYDDLKSNSDKLNPAEQARGFKEISSEANSLTRELDRGNDMWRTMARVADDAKKSASGASGGGVFGNLMSGDGLASVDRAFQSLSSNVDKVGIKIVSLSAELRGFVLSLGLGLFQQLDTAIVGVVGSLFSVGSAATQAAAAVGGTFVAAIGQAIPVLSVFAGALDRIKMVFAAVSAAQALQASNYASPNQGLINQLQNTNSLVQAEQSLANAYLQVKEAQEALQSSSLNITEARQALSKAESTGSQEGIEQAQQALRAAQLNRSEARNSLSQARTAVPAAQRQIRITQLTAAEPSSQASSQTSTLDYDLSKLTPVEKQLYDSLDKLANYIQSPNSPFTKISDYLVAPFVTATNRIYKLLNDKAFLAPLSSLGQALGKGIGDIFGTIDGKKGASFFETMADDATKNVPKVVGIIENLIKMFEDIAKAAAPALKIFLDGIDNLTGKLSTNWSSPQGLKDLTKFFDNGAKYAGDIARLAGAFGGLLGALGGDAAPVGGTLMDQAVKSLNGMTTWVNQHGSEVKNFFEQAGVAFGDFFKILGSIGKGMTDLMNAGALTNFSKLLSDVIVPVLVDAAKILGKFTDAIIFLFDEVPHLHTIIDVLGGFGVAAVVVGKLYSPLKRVAGLINSLSGGRLGKLFGGGKVDIASTAMTDAAEGMNTAGDKMLRAAGLMDDAAVKQDLAGAEMDAGGAENVVGGAASSATTAAEEGTESLGIAGVASTGMKLIPILGGGYIAAKATGLDNITAGTSTSGLLKSASSGAIAGAVGGAAAGAVTGPGALITGAAGAIAGGTAGIFTDLLFGKGGESPTQKALSQLKSDLKGVTDPAQLSTSQLKKFYDQTLQIQGMGDLTATQRKSLEKLSTDLDPLVVKTKAIETQWSSSFQNISNVTGDVMNLTSQNLSQQIGKISTNLGTGTSAGQKALIGTISGAVTAVMSNTSKMVRDTSGKMTQLNTIFGHALSALGINISPSVLQQLDPKQIEDISRTSSTGNTLNITSLKQAKADAGLGENIPGAASGAWHSARPGGSIVNVGEGGHDEVTLSTDPAHASRSGALLGKYFKSMASGGFVIPQIQDLSGIPGIVGQGDVNTVGGVMKSVLNAAGKTGKAAGTVLGKSVGSITGSGIKTGTWMSVVSQIAAKMGWNSAQIAAWQGVESDEDGSLSLTAENPSGAYGLAQMLSTTPATSREKYYTYGGNPNTLVGQLTGMANYIKDTYGNPEGALAHEDSHHWYADGGVASWGGRPVPIVAHEGERISNPGQWNHIAGMSGMTGSQLDDHMGYSKGGRPRQFDVGGTVPYTASQGASGVSNIKGPDLSQINGFLQNITSNLYDLDVGSVTGSLTTISNLGTVVNKAFQKINKLGGASTKAGMDKISNLLENFADPNNVDSTLNVLATSFTRFQNNLSNMVTNRSFSARAGSSSSAVARRGTTVGADALGLQSLSGQGRYLDGVNKANQDAINEVKSQIQTDTSELGSGASSSTAKTDIAKLKLSYNNLIQQQETLGQAINSNVTARFQAEQQYVQDTITQINDFYQTQQTNLQASQSNAQTTGQYGKLSGRNGFDMQLARSATRQISVLQKPLKDAEKEGDADSVASIKQQISQLRETAAQAAAQALTDQITGITNAAQTSQAGLQTKQSDASTMGNYGKLPKIDTAVGDAATAEINKLKVTLKAAEKSGNTSAVQSIQQQMDQLQQTAAQAAAQAISDQVTGITNAAQTKQAGIQTRQSDATTMGNYSILPAIDATMQAAAVSEVSKLQGALAAARKAGDTGAVQSITQQIDQLQSTITESAAQMISDTISGIQQTAATASAASSMYSTVGQTMEGAASSVAGFQAAGNVTAAGLQINQSSIQSQLSQYQNLLGQAVQQGNVGAFNTITQQIDELNGQLAQNTQAITDNTANVISETASYIQSRGQFTSGVYGGISSILTTIGQTTGNTNVAGLIGAAQGSNSSLQSTNSGLVGQLAGLGGGASGLASSLSGVTDPGQLAGILGGANMGNIESGQSATWVTAFEGIVTNLESNTEAIATNNEQLATLNGQFEQPQTWATSAWTSFRAAIFNGMGNLVPSAAASIAGTSAMPTIAPIYSSVSSGGVVPTVGTLNINHAPLSSLSSQVTGQQFAHEISGALA